MAYYGDVSAEARDKIRALEIKLSSDIQELSNEFPDLSVRKIKQLIVDDMRVKKPINKRGPSFYNSYISEESKKCGSLEEAAKKYSQLPESEKQALKEAYTKNPTPAQLESERQLACPFNTYTERLKKLADEMYTEANCHVIAYVTQRQSPGTTLSHCRSCSVYGTEVARMFAVNDMGFMGLGTQYGFSSFVLRYDNGGQVVPLNKPTLTKTRVQGNTTTTVKEAQIQQAKHRAEFVKLVLNTMKKGDDTGRLKHLKMVPWKKLQQTRRSKGLRLVGWPEKIPIESSISREDQLQIASLIERGKIMFI